MTSVLVTIGHAAMNALAFNDTNFLFSKLKDHIKKEHKRHDLTLEKLQKASSEWNEDRMKQLDFIKKRPLEKNEGRAYINNVDEAILEYYQVFAKQIKPLPPEPQLSNFYHQSGAQKMVNYYLLQQAQVWKHMPFTST